MFWLKGKRLIEPRNKCESDSIARVDDPFDVLELAPDVLVLAVPFELREKYLEDIVRNSFGIFRPENFFEWPNRAGVQLNLKPRGRSPHLPVCLRLFSTPLVFGEVPTFSGWRAHRYLQDIFFVSYPDFAGVAQLQVEEAQLAAGDDEDSPQARLSVDLRL